MRIVRRLLLAVILLAVVAVLGLATPPGRSIVVGLIARAASGSGLVVTIDGASGWPPFWLGAEKVTIADGTGAFAEADNVQIDVKVWPLLTGNIELASVTADRVAIERQPEIPGGGGDGALLPFAANQVSVARLELGAALAGRPAVLSLNGSASVSRAGALAASIDAERIDGKTGTLTATLSRADARAPLSADIDLREGPDGILTGLMGRPSGPGYALTAKTGLDGDTFGGDLTLTSDGNANFSGRFAIAPAGEGQRLTLNGAGDLAELVPPQFAGLLGGRIDVVVDADWAWADGAPLPQLTVREGMISTGSVSATASGTLDDDATNLTVSLDAADTTGAALPLPFLSVPASLERISLNGTIRPDGDALRLELVGRSVGLAVGENSAPNLGLSLAIEAPLDNPLAGDNLPFALRAEADAVESPAGRVESSTGAPLLLIANGTLDTATMSAETNAQISAAGGETTFAGTVSAETVSGTATIAFSDVRPLSPLAGRSIAGAVDATAEGTFVGADRSFTVTGSAVDLDVGNATVTRLLSGVTGFSGKVALQPDGAIAFSDATVDGISFDARGGVTLTADTVDATLDGSLADLGLVSEASSGAATFTARITGGRTRPDIDATVTVADGQLAGQAISNATIGFQGAPSDNGGWQGALTLRGGFAGGPLEGTANVVVDGATGLMTFPDVNLAVGQNRIVGSVERTAAGPLSGTLTVDAPDLRTLAALALVDATGNGRADVRFEPDGDRQSISVAFNGSGVSYGNASAASIQGEAVIADAFGAPQVRGNATANSLAVGGLRLDSAQATATVSGGATQFQANASGPDLNLRGSGSLSGAAGNQTVRLDTLSGTAFRFPVNLNQPVTISLDGSQSRISGATLALGGGTVRVDGTATPALNLTVAVRNVSASVANSFAPALGAEGAISGDATVTGTAAAPVIAWTASWSGLRTAATRNAGLPALAATARGNANRTGTGITANLTGAGLSLAITGQVPYAGSGLNLRAQGTAPLALLAAGSSREVRVAGTARVNLTITGSTASPAIAGTIDVVDGTYADTSSGFGVVGANGRIDFDGRRAMVRQITGRMGQGGELTVAGTVDVTSAGLPANLTIRIVNGRIADGTINSTFSGNLAVTGPLAGNGVVSGTIALARTEIQLPDRIGASASAIEVRHINAPASFVPPEPRLRPTGGPGRAATSSGGSGGLRLDITLTSTLGVMVRGFGIDAELGGSLRLAGTTGNPQAVGGLTMRRGRIEALGRRFEFTRGTLTFAGDLMPFVDFAATTRTTDATVTLNVTGPINDPDIIFTSSPQMPEEEILSRLLFQRNVGALSPIQAAQLVDAVAQLTGAVGSGGILGRIRAATGLDDIDIRQTATGGTEVGIGRRINENLRLGVEAGSDGGRVVIDLDITRNLKAQAEAGQDGRGKIGLTYEREY